MTALCQKRMKAKNEYMYMLFGKSEQPDAKCRDCAHLIANMKNRKHFKCECYGDTACESTDWRLKYDACGLFNKAYTGIPVIELKKHSKKPFLEQQIDGQITIGELYEIHG